jgi:hypothetical protein
MVRSFTEKVASDSRLDNLLLKLAAFKSETRNDLTTRLSPFRKDMTSKIKPSHTVEAPAKNVMSAGIADSQPIAQNV